MTDPSKSGPKYRNRSPATSGFIARSYPLAVWLRPSTSVPTNAFQMRMKPFASGAPAMGTGVRVLPGRFTATGRRAGTLIRQRYAPMFSILLHDPKV